MATKTTFINKVLQLMNEVGWNDTSSAAFLGADTAHVEKHIESVFPDAWRQAVKILPKHYFSIKDFSANPHTADIYSGTGHVELPDDFYSLYSFRMEGWRTAASVFYTEDDYMARLQANEYTRGSAVRPVCIQRTKAIEASNGTIVIKKILEYYSLPKGRDHVLEEALYIPHINGINELEKIGDLLIIPLAYLCAALVYNIFEKYDIAKTLEQKAIETA